MYFAVFGRSWFIHERDCIGSVPLLLMVTPKPRFGHSSSNNSGLDRKYFLSTRFQRNFTRSGNVVRIVMKIFSIKISIVSKALPVGRHAVNEDSSLEPGDRHGWVAMYFTSDLMRLSLTYRLTVQCFRKVWWHCWHTKQAVEKFNHSWSPSHTSFQDPAEKSIEPTFVCFPHKFVYCHKKVGLRKRMSVYPCLHITLRDKKVPREGKWAGPKLLVKPTITERWGNDQQ